MNIFKPPPLLPVNLLGLGPFQIPLDLEWSRTSKNKSKSVTQFSNPPSLCLAKNKMLVFYFGGFPFFSEKKISCSPVMLIFWNDHNQFCVVNVSQFQILLLGNFGGGG